MRFNRLARLAGMLAVCAGGFCRISGAEVVSPVTILTFCGKVEISRRENVWDPAYTNQVLVGGDKLKTGPRSRAALRLSDGTTMTIGAEASCEVPESKQGVTLNPLKGLFYFFHRDKPGEFELRSRTASAAVRGTEFLLEADEDGTWLLSVLDGDVLLQTTEGTLDLKTGDAAVAKPGQRPQPVVMRRAVDLIQWCFYYPAVLEADELVLSPAEQEALRNSLSAYREGDLGAALARCSFDRPASSDMEALYRAELLLSVGEVAEAETLLAGLSLTGEHARLIGSLKTALQELMAVVKGLARVRSNTQKPETASEWLAESYRLQSESRLPEALAAARNSVEKSPPFGFGWERVAELEFSFGRIPKALAALNKSLGLAPRNAQAVALQGFLLSAQNRVSEALSLFEHAIALDGALGNGWLGRGLCRIRRGENLPGLEDLEVAAALEPNRSLLRSYLGKAFSQTGDNLRAEHELLLARELDSKDPTSWLYSALLRQQQNRINEAIGDLEESEALNTNRSIFRSGLLLDQDRAVRSANLAAIYRDAGMAEVSVREAARAVTYDYANDSAHLFLSDGYNELRDPTRFNLRYETVWFNELLLANLLSPVGAGRLSQQVSQQEYSRLFEADGLHLASSTQARTDGMFTELASQFGTFGGTSYALDLDYQHNNGVRPNNDLDDIEWYTTVKQQLTPQDIALVLLKYEDYHSGDNFQYYDPLNPTNGFRPHFRFDEYQHPILVGGWHHEWSPGIHTLFLCGRLEDEQQFSDRAAPQLLLTEFSNGEIARSVPATFDVDYHNELEIYTAEVNQIFEWDKITLSAGGRYQSGSFNTQARMANPSGPPLFLFAGTPTNTASTDDFERLTGYGYLTVEPLEGLWLTGGLAYDDITYPRNFRNPPISPGEDHRMQVGPKAALVWSPAPQVTVRGAFTRSLGGVSLDESYRLEPTQLAGFPQAFRTLISESVVGSVAAPEFETVGLALDLKFPSGTYAGVQAQHLESNVRRTIGLFSLVDGNPPFVPDSTLERLDYRENSLSVNLNQLMGDALVVGLSYNLDQVLLHDVLPDVPLGALNTADLSKRGYLHQVSGYILFNHPSGFFARAETHWYHQSNSGDPSVGPGDDFIQYHLFAGYRFAQRRVEIQLGLLNLTAQDYHLSPLTVYAELPRGRTLMVQLKFQF